MRPDLALLDLQMPGIRGLDAINPILAIAPQVRISLMTSTCPDSVLRGAFAAGVSGCVLKDALMEELTQAIKGVLEGKRHLPATGYKNGFWPVT